MYISFAAFCRLEVTKHFAGRFGVKQAQTRTRR